MKIKILNLFFLLVIISVNISSSQDINKSTKYRLAFNLEQSGEWEQAAAIYEELYKSDPMNLNYLNGLQRSYAHLKEYDKAIGIMHRWFVTHPRDIILMSALGGLYYETGNETASDSVWNAALSIDPRNLNNYRIIANEMMEHRLYEKCIRTYISGRVALKDESLFADELGNLYAALQQYKSAAQEYVRRMKKNPDQLQFVQLRLKSFIFRPDALMQVSEAIKSEVNNSPDNIGLHRLYAWLLAEENKYEPALEHYRIIDRMTNAEGRELYAFAQTLIQEHQPKTAAKVFKEIIDRYNKSSILPYARFGYARALEEIDNESFKNDPGSRPTYLEAIQIYESIAAVPNRHDLAVQSFFRIGIIKSERTFDLDGALKAFDRITKTANAMDIELDAVIRKGNIQVARNNLTEARREFESAAKIPLPASQERAVFRLAELEYFEADFDTSLALLKQFNSKLNTDLTNDALQLQYFIMENKISSLPALTEFAKADLQMRQRNFSESLNRFGEIVRQYPDALLLDDAMMKIGELNSLLKRPKEAIAAFGFIIDSIQLSILKDKAQFSIAEIYEKVLQDKAQAAAEYEKLLELFPNSLYAEQARKKIRMLRGDIL
ncbi:MAG: tetratricopeptide repeat protein [Bacteroidetes bacterium]|nr:tetratricopeptide repeat protein [Bacteroidota bacterium]